MSTANGGSRSSSQKRNNSKIAEKFKAACPPSKWKELDLLVKSLKGDEEKIQAKISEWWEEPQTVEPEWEDVNKKGKRSSARHGGGGGSRSDRGSREGRGGRGGGRGFHGRGMGGGRGAGAERRSRDYGGKSDRQQRSSASTNGHSTRQHPTTDNHTGSPTPVTNLPRPKGAWGQHASASAASNTPAPSAASVDKPEPIVKPENEMTDVGIVSSQDPTPAGLVETNSKPKTDILPQTVSSPVINSLPSSTATGNVWATKGGRNLIEAEKPKPPPLPNVQVHSQRQTQPAISQEPMTKQEIPPAQPAGPSIQDESEEDEPVLEEPEALPVPEPQPAVPNSVPEESVVAVISPEPDVDPPAPPGAEDVLDSGLPASVNGANVNAAGWEPLLENSTGPTQSSVDVELEPPSPVRPVSVPSVPSVSDVALAIGQEAGSSIEETAPISVVEDAPISSTTELITDTPTPAPVVPTESEPSRPHISSSTANVLNMGHWETAADAEEAHSLDFGFGAFGVDNEVASVDETTISSSTNNNAVSDPSSTSLQTKLQPSSAPPPQAQSQPLPVDSAQPAPPAPTTTTTTVSPARPPPGLSIAMPPMPANVVHVHELENKLETASLSAAPKPDDSVVPTTQVPEKPMDPSLSEKKPITPNLASAAQSTQSQQVGNPPESITPIIQQGGMSQNYTPAYGMGMYSYNAPNSATGGAAAGFVGVHTPAGPVLASAVVPQQKPLTSAQQQAGSAPGGAPPLHQPQQTGLYGGPSSAGATITGSDTSVSTPNESAASATGMPPGIPGGMPFNPALFYGQQHYQMGQPHGGIGYGYGYGAQYGGAVQGGFGYQQVMGQSGGYGQPYDDQPPQQHHGSHNSHHNASTHQGGYQKGGHGGGGGYRGRGSHHNNHHNSHGSGAHQYQNQYTPQQHGGYGGQPYGMGYNVDHFNQRGGYGPGSIDPYTMPQNSSGYQGAIGHSSGGFSAQDDGDQSQHGKGKAKGARVNNTSFGGNPTMQQFQQQGPPQQQGAQSAQQPFGLQGGVSDVSTAPGATSGWSNPSWGGPSWQGN